AAGQSYQVTPNANTFAGIFGGSVFYSDAALTRGTNVASAANLFRFNVADQSTTQITNVGDARFVNISADGSRAYFISDSQINGDGTAGQPNLYLWDRHSGATSYVATVAPTDETGDLDPDTLSEQNLAAWSAANQASSQSLPSADQGRAT